MSGDSGQPLFACEMASRETRSITQISNVKPQYDPKTAKKADEDVIREGWKILIDNMGVAKATRFLTAFERGN